MTPTVAPPGRQRMGQAEINVGERWIFCDVGHARPRARKMGVEAGWQWRSPSAKMREICGERADILSPSVQAGRGAVRQSASGE